jgi:hypothetical protein
MPSEPPKKHDESAHALVSAKVNNEFTFDEPKDMPTIFMSTSKKETDRSHKSTDKEPHFKILSFTSTVN